MTASIVDLQEGARFFHCQWLPMYVMGTQGAKDTALILQNLSAHLYACARRELGVEP